MLILFSKYPHLLLRDTQANAKLSKNLKYRIFRLGKFEGKLSILQFRFMKV